MLLLEYLLRDFKDMIGGWVVVFGIRVWMHLCLGCAVVVSLCINAYGRFLQDVEQISQFVEKGFGFVSALRVWALIMLLLILSLV